ncbi:class I tRNA ligase family protein [Patescibacteria group bacterium]|nr:class I tRNA ligase family protein [Patescibacteria group bacterium]
MNEKFLSPYNPTDTEDKIYQMWEQSGFFNPDEMIKAGLTDAQAETFSIVLPPPNVTGQLHLGHSFEDATQDAMIRFHRMLGKRTLWMPGTDHAAIATQSKFEKELYKKEKKSRHDYSREEFFSMIEEFALSNQSTILSQLRKMGASLDWDRLCFTLDEQRKEAVFEAFKQMYEAGLVYRKERVVNWDVKGQTTISDDEIVREDRISTMYTFKYSHDCPIEIASTRPETKLGDTAIAVHPDGRWKSYIGKEYSFEFAGESVTVTVIGDKDVDPEFGTGALGVTPAHSFTDWDMAQRHDLPLKQIINEYGKMMVGMEGVKGEKVEKAREAVVAWLRDQKLFIDEEDVAQSIATAERTGGIIEPLPKMQWWINVQSTFSYPHDSLKGIKKGQKVSLKDLMLHVVESGQVTIMPERFDKSYRHWIENLRDWNISRQIFFGHQVPVWYDKDGNLNLPEEKTVYFVRHGESEDNVAQLFGRPDSPLTDLGREQARESGKKLKSEEITKIYTSPYPRAIETANIIAKEIGYQGEIAILEDLHEIDQGNLAGTPLLPKNERLPNVFKKGESHKDFIARINRIKEFIKNEAEENSLFVSHTGFSTCFFSVLNGKESIEDLTYADEHQHFQNGEVRSKTFIIEPKENGLIQDEDTLDTWFSSGLWSFSTLGWPEKTKDLEDYHPTSLLNPGYEILPLWVSRMILFSTFLVGEIPFETVYIHGMLRDKDGRKFSKSLNNGIDPLEVIDQYGTDALRMALIIGVTPGQDMSFDLQKVKAYSKFANKLWNIARFIITETESVAINNAPMYSSRDQELLGQQKALIEEITKEMNEHKLYLVAEKLYHYVWHTLADEILEESKTIFETGSQEDITSRRRFLYETLLTMLKTLHPFMPFVTEEIWQSMQKPESERDILMTSLWPIL